VWVNAVCVGKSVNPVPPIARPPCCLCGAMRPKRSTNTHPHPHNKTKTAPSSNARARRWRTTAASSKKSSGSGSRAPLPPPPRLALPPPVSLPLGVVVVGRVVGVGARGALCSRGVCVSVCGIGPSSRLVRLWGGWWGICVGGKWGGGWMGCVWARGYLGRRERAFFACFLE
jgi:hypothetical protein